MNEPTQSSENGNFVQTARTALRLGLVLLIVYWCYLILLPFIPLVVWGGIIAVAIYPLQLRLSARLGDRDKLSAALITVLGLLILTVPTLLLTESLVTTSTELATDISDGSVAIPTPPNQIQEWPVVGKRLHATWLLASENVGAATRQFGPQLEAARESLIAAAGGAGKAFLQLFFSTIIAGVFLAGIEGSMAAIRRVVNWLVGARGAEVLALSEATIRSVAVGVVGVAIMETIVVAVGLLAANVPAAGFWTMLILMFSIVQIPPLLPLIPLAIYVLYTAEPVGATVFIICSVLAVLIDTFVKPILLGRGADAPMLIVLMGAIGGMIIAGVVGLFAGAVVLVVGWELLQFCFNEDDAAATSLQHPQD